MSSEFAGKTAVVTGGAGGIGGEIARHLAKNGARLALLDINDEALDAARAEHPDAFVAKLDVTDLAAFERVCADIEHETGGIDILVSVAGGGIPKTLDGMTADDWSRTVNLNLTGPFNGIKAVAPYMRKRGGGVIVTVSSVAAHQISLNNGVSYTAAKAGVLGLTRHAAFELSADNIRVNTVLPGAIMTDQMRRKVDAETLESVPKRTPIGRWLTQEDVAGPVLFLCSSASAACTGTHLVVDGGWSIGGPPDREVYFRKRKSVAP